MAKQKDLTWLIIPASIIGAGIILYKMLKQATPIGVGIENIDRFMKQATILIGELKVPIWWDVQQDYLGDLDGGYNYLIRSVGDDTVKVWIYQGKKLVSSKEYSL